MNYPERIILIAAMAGIVAAGFTWFGWELLENLFALAGRKRSAGVALPESAAAGQHEQERS